MISSILTDEQDDRWATTVRDLPYSFPHFLVFSNHPTLFLLRPFILLPEWMFFDVAKINAKGGDGGDGCMAMRRVFRIEFGGPSGGNGGHGGSVYLECDSSLNTLSLLRRRVHHRGKDGTNGKGDSRHGQKGKDSVVYVPPGTIVR